MLQTIIKEQDAAGIGNAGLSPSVRWTLASLSLPMLLSSLGTSSANVSLPTLAQTFSASFQQVQWVVLAYLLAITALIVSVGRLGDIIGRRRLLLAGILLFTAASILCGVAPTLWLLITARAAQGLGAAVMMALTVAMVGESVPQEKTGNAMGLLGTMSAIGTTLGPSLGGVLITGLGWRTIFLVNVPLGILSFFLAYRYLPVDRRAVNKEHWADFDSVGTLLLALTLGAYALAMTVGRGSLSSHNTALLLATVLGVGVFILVEARIASPLIPLWMFRDRVLSASLAMSTLVSTVMMATLVVGPFYLSRGLGLETAVVGLALSVGPLVAALTGVPAGRIVDRFGTGRMTIIGLIGMAVGSCLLSMMPASFGVAGYITPIVVITASYVLFQAANNTAIMTGIHPNQRGVITGMLNLSRNLGLITGAYLLGAVFALASATTDITTARPEVVATGMRIGDLLRMRWSDVDRHFKKLRVRLGKSETEDFLVHISETAAAVIARRTENKLGDSKYIFTCRDHSIRDALRNASAAAGVPYGQQVEGGWSIHDIRRTFLTYLLQAGVDVATVRDIAGHSCVSITSRYVHSTTESRLKALGAAENLVRLASGLEGKQVRKGYQGKAGDTRKRNVNQ